LQLIPYSKILTLQGGNCEIDGKFDGEDFQSLLSAMQVLGFTSEEQDTIFRILASGKYAQFLVHYSHSTTANLDHSQVSILFVYFY
jgi:myosin-15